MEEGISIFRKALHMSRASSSSPQDARKQVVLRVLGILLVLALSFLVLWFQESLRRMAPYGYAGVFFLTLAANASVILPLPGLVLPFTMGAVLHHPMAAAPFPVLGLPGQAHQNAGHHLLRGMATSMDGIGLNPV